MPQGERASPERGFFCLDRHYARIARAISAAAQLKVSEINLEAAKVRAEITRTKGEAEANAKFLVENEEALGAKRRAAAFKTPGTLADLEFAKNLNPEVSIRVLHSGEGTLWTDLKGAAISMPPRAKQP